jgi:hypothetical protein
MKKKRNTWRSRLTKKEIKHMTEDAVCKTLDDLKRNFSRQAKMRIQFPKVEPLLGL